MLSSRLSIASGLCAVVVATAGCGGEGGGASASYTVRDSAGVRIVENRGPAWTAEQQWAVEPAPVVRIGVVEGDSAYQFYRISAVDLLADGGIVVLDAGSAELRSYDAAGRHEWSAGGRGQGPGQFEQPSYLGQRPDGSFFIWDRSLARLTVIGVGGEYVRTETYAPTSHEPPIAHGVFADGALLVTFPHSIRPPAPGTLLSDTIGLWRFDRVTRERRLLARLRGPVWMWTGRYQLLVPFTINPLRATTGTRLLVASGATPEVRTYDAAGRLIAIHILPQRSVPVTTTDIHRMVDGWVDRRMYGASAAVWREWLDRMPVPSERPAFDRLVVDGEDNVWLRRLLPAMDSATAPVWDIVGPDGVYFGSVRTPAAFEVMAIDGEALAGVATDSLGVEQVRVYRLH